MRSDTVNGMIEKVVLGEHQNIRKKNIVWFTDQGLRAAISMLLITVDIS